MRVSSLASDMSSFLLSGNLLVLSHISLYLHTHRLDEHTLLVSRGNLRVHLIQKKVQLKGMLIVLQLPCSGKSQLVIN